jgi:hypothetical protein
MAAAKAMSVLTLSEDLMTIIVNTHFTMGVSGVMGLLFTRLDGSIGTAGINAGL